MLTMSEARRVKSQRRYGQNDITCLYRLYDEAWDLLYVGVTRMHLADRFNGHSRVHQWWQQIEHVRLEWHLYGGFALDAEREAIRNEFPRFNKRSALVREPIRSGS